MRSEFLSEFLSHLLRRFEVPFHHTDIGERKCLSKLPFGECDRISKKSRRLISPYYVVMYRRISPAIDGTGVEPVWPALSGLLRSPCRTRFAVLEERPVFVSVRVTAVISLTKMGALFFSGSHKRNYAAVRIIFFYVRLLHLYSWSYFGRDILMALLMVLSSSAQRYPLPTNSAHNNEDCLGSLLIIVNCVHRVLICFFISSKKLILF